MILIIFVLIQAVVNTGWVALTCDVNHFCIGTGGSEYWLGGTDMFENKHWVWVSSLQSIKQTHWKHAEPTNSNGGESCLSIYTDLGWNDEECSSLSRLHFICEAE